MLPDSKVGIIRCISMVPSPIIGQCPLQSNCIASKCNCVAVTSNHIEVVWIGDLTAINIDLNDDIHEDNL